MTRMWGMILALLLPVMAAAQDADARRITVTGTGISTQANDAAVLRFGVESEAETAGEAMEMLAADLGAVLDAIAAEGVPEEAVATSQLSLYQRQESGSLGSLPGTAVYAASSILTVRSDETANIGDLLDAAVDAGANRIDSVSFEVSDPAAALVEARRLAVADGFAKAAVMAEAAGVTLGDLMILRDAAGSAGPGPMVREMTMSVPVVAGQGEISVTVEMIFAIN